MARDEASAYLAARPRLSVVAGVLTPNAVAWRRLDEAAARVRTRLIVSGGGADRPARRCTVIGWGFRDRSRLAVLPARGPWPAALEALSRHGLGYVCLIDSVRALRAAFMCEDPFLRVFLPRLWVQAYGSFPRLPRPCLLAALESDDPRVRVAAIQALSSHDLTS